MTNSPVRPDSAALADPAPSRWPWSYLHLTIAASALAFATYGQSGDYWDSVTSFAIVWVTAGLAIQAAEIWQALRREKDLIGEQRTAWRFDALWRVALAVTLPMYYLQRDAGHLLTDPDGAPHASFATELQFVLFAISLITSLSSNGRLSVVTARRGWRQASSKIIVWASVVGLALFIVCQALMPAAVERVVTAVLDVMEPSDALGNDEKLALRQSQFVARALVAGSAGLLAVFLARRLGNARQVSGKQAALYACLTIAILGFAANSLVWLVSQGGSLATNAFSDAEQSWFGGTWRGLSCLLLFVTTALAWRFTMKSPDSPPMSAVGWRSHPQHYHHESRWIATLLFVATIGQLWAKVSYLFGFFRTRALDWSMVAERFGLVLAECVTQPAFILLATISLVALRGVIGQRVTELSANQATVRSLSERRFAVVWLTLIVALAIETAALAWIGFSLWHSSWQVALPIDA